MLRRRVCRAESLLQRQEAASQAVTTERESLVAALRALLEQLREADPFPSLQGADYLWAFWPWLLSGAERWPAWAVNYALALGGLPAVAGRLARCGPPPPAQPLRGVSDLVRLLHEQMEAVRADEVATSLERARVIGSLAGQARRALEIGQLVARVEMLEMVLKQRNGEMPR